VVLACGVQWKHGGIVQRGAWQRCAFVEGMVFGGYGGMVIGGIALSLAVETFSLASFTSF